MKLEYLTIKRAIVHEIPDGNSDQPAPPACSDELVALTPKAKSGLQERITAALGHKSKAIQMHRKESDATGVHNTIAQLYDCTEKEFISGSKNLAERLATAQSDRRIPGGKLILFTGTADIQKVSILGIIKAELETGFQENLRFLENIFLTPSQKMYKIAIFVKHSARKEEIWIYDSNMTSNEERGAATYFYASFLACDFHRSNARLTQQFFKQTKNFINSLATDGDRKIDLASALSSYLKSNDNVISPADFSKKHFSALEREEYDALLQKHHLTKGILKDLASISSSLRNRRIIFDSKVKVVGPADDFSRLVKVVSSNGNSTTLKITGTVQQQ